MKPGNCTPILRIFDEAKAREFYCMYLGFEVDFEHRFEEGMPLYLGLKSGDLEFHLSEHHGDATPGSAVRVEIEDIQAFHASLEARQYKYIRPGVEVMPWGERQVKVTDPFGNRIIFWEAIEKRQEPGQP